MKFLETENPYQEAAGRGSDNTQHQEADINNTPETSKNQSIPNMDWLPVLAENIPAMLRDTHRWLCWRAVWNPDRKKWDKRPYQVNGRAASVSDPATWGNFDDCLFAYENLSGFDGLGFVLDGSDGLVGIDLDDCIKDGKLTPEASEIVRRFAGYTERSPSGTGIRIFIRGKLPPSGRRKGKFEVYESGRFLTVTGGRVSGTPATIERRQEALDWFHARFIAAPKTPDAQEGHSEAGKSVYLLTDEEALAKAKGSPQGFLFDTLWAGDWESPRNDDGSQRYTSQSEADLALCGILAFWCGHDVERIDRMFRQSGLMRDKWDEQHGAETYGEMTIRKAIESGGAVYDPEWRPGPASGPAIATGVRVGILAASKVEPKPIFWLWPGYLPAGMLVLLAGSPGSGKTSLALTWAALVSRGERFPDGFTPHEPGGTLLWSGEDPLSEVLIPRLIAAGADLDRIGIVKSATGKDGLDVSFDPATDVPALKHEIQRRADAGQPVRLIVVDPIISAVRGDAHRNNETRRALQPLVNLADETGAAVLGVTHLTKGSQGRNPAERINGSVAFSAIARVVLIAAEANTEPRQRVLTVAKSNISRTGGGFKYQLTQTTLAVNPDITTSKIEWDGAASGTAQELIDTAEETGVARFAAGEAENFLKVELKDGPVPAKEIRRRAADAGIAEITLRRAKDRLKIKSVKGRDSSTAGWSWQLPAGPEMDSHRVGGEDSQPLYTI